MERTRSRYLIGGGKSLWRVIIFSILFTVSASLVWHESGMMSVRRELENALRKEEHELRELREYRNILATSGREAGTRYLLASTTEFRAF